MFFNVVYADLTPCLNVGWRLEHTVTAPLLFLKQPHNNV